MLKVLLDMRRSVLTLTLWAIAYGFSMATCLQQKNSLMNNQCIQNNKNHEDDNSRTGIFTWLLYGGLCLTVFFCAKVLRLTIWFGFGFLEDVKRIQRSLRHQYKLDVLMNMLKRKSSAVETIGVYKVCFEDRFLIGSGVNDTQVFVGLGTDGLEVAVKRVNLKWVSLAKNEKEILNSSTLMKSAHVLNYRFYHEKEKYAYIVTDLQDETLEEFVQSEKFNLTDLLKKGPTILKQILLGIQSLHDANILHRHLKPDNVLLNSEGKIVLADFGISQRLEHDMLTHHSGIRGEKGWTATESLPNDDETADDENTQPFDKLEVRYKKSSDIQVLGMLFYYVLTKGKHPYGKWYFDRLSNIRKGKYDLSRLTDPVAKDLIKWMLNENPDERPTVEQCLKHPYIMSLDENFEFLTVVGSEPEFRYRKAESNNSRVIQDSDQEDSLTTPPWSKKIDEELYNHVDDPGNKYGNTVADLLHFIRKADEHWSDKPAFAERFGTAPAYFLKVFPTLPMIVHNSIRKDPKWNARVKVKKFL